MAIGCCRPKWACLALTLSFAWPVFLAPGALADGTGAPKNQLLHAVQYSRAEPGTRVASDNRNEQWTSPGHGGASGRIGVTLYRSPAGAVHEIIVTAESGGPSVYMFLYAYSVLLRADGSVVSTVRAEIIASGDLSGRTVVRTGRAENKFAEQAIPEVRYMASALVACGRVIVFGTVEDSNRCEPKRQAVWRAFEDIVAAQRLTGTAEQLAASGWSVVGVGEGGAGFNVAVFNPPLCNPPFPPRRQPFAPDEMARRYVQDYVTPQLNQAIRALPPEGRAAANAEAEAFTRRVARAIRDYESVEVTPGKVERFLQGEAPRTRAGLPYYNRCVQRLGAAGLDDAAQIAARAFLAMRDRVDGLPSGSVYQPMHDDTMRRWVYGLEFPLTDEERGRLTEEQRGNRSFTLLDYLTSSGAPLGVKLHWYGFVRHDIMSGTNRR